MDTRSVNDGSNTSLAMRAWQIRRNALLMGEVQGQGYIGQALGIADVLAVSYSHALAYRAQDRNGRAATAFCSPSDITPSRSMRR